MNDAREVRGVQGQSCLIHHVENEVERGAGIAFEVGGERLAVEVLHHHVSQIAVFHARNAEIGHVDHVGVMQSPGCFGLALEALGELRFRG